MGSSKMNEQYAVRLIEADHTLIDPNDSAAAKRMMLLFEEIDFDTIKTVCDIGSRFLEQTMEMAHIFPTAKFHAFEPVPGSYQLCCDNRAKLDDEYKDRITVYNMAVGEQSAEIPFYAVDDTGSEFNVGASSKFQFVPGLNGSFFGKTWNQTEIRVKQTTLDEWREQNNIGPVDLIWIDAQGGELDAFRGAEQTLKDVKVILSEVGIDTYYQGQSLKPDIDAYLSSQGFVELEGGFEVSHQFEGNTIYIKK